MANRVDKSLSDIAYDHIRQRLMRGELKPGTRLVNRALAREIGISFTPVREAINRLSSEGMIEQIPGAGAYVRRMNRAELIDLHGVREAIECYAAGEAASKADEDQMGQLEDLCGEMKSMAESIRGIADGLLRRPALDRWMAVDVRYHEVLLDAAKNALVTKIVRDLNLLALVFQSRPNELTLGMTAETYRTHSELVRAIRKRNAELAVYWMRVQIRRGLATVLRTIAADSREPWTKTVI
jgi:DNA-binding GntR family transcriptional regulator